MIETFEAFARACSLPDAIKKEYIFDKRKKAAHLFFYFKDFVADLVYLSNGAGGQRGILSAHICPREDVPLYLFLSEAMLIVDPKRYICSTYFSVAGKEKLSLCLDELFGILISALPELLAFMDSPENRQKMFFGRAEELNDYLNADCFLCENGGFTDADDGFTDPYIPLIDLFYVSKYSSYAKAPYADFYKGKPDKALAGLARKHRKSAEYEALSKLLEEEISFTALQKELFVKGLRGSRFADLPKVVGCILLYMLIAALPAALFFCALFLFSAGYFDGTTLFSTSYLSLPYLFLPVMLGGPLLFCFDQRLFYRAFYGKSEYADYEKMQGVGGRRVMRIFGSLVLVFLIVETVLMGHQTVRFKENGFSVDARHFSFEEKNYLYEQIENASFIGSGEEKRLVFSLSDGSEIVFTDALYVDEKTADEKILPILARKGVQVTNGNIKDESEAANETV